MTLTVPKIAQIRKAIAGGVAALVPLLTVDIASNNFTQADILGLVGAFVGGLLVVFGVPNADVAKVTAAIDPKP